MKNPLKGKIFFIMILIIILIFGVFTACKSGDDGKKDDDTTLKKESDIIKHLPKWYFDPPLKDDVIYAVGYGKSANMNLAKDTAEQFARDEIARVIKVKISTMTKQFLEEAGVDDQKQLTEYASTTSKSVANTSLVGSRAVERDIFVLEQTADDGSVKEVFISVVLMEMSLDYMKKVAKNLLDPNDPEYIKLKANKSIEELNTEVNNLNTKDFDETKKPDVE